MINNRQHMFDAYRVLVDLSHCTRKPKMYIVHAFYMLCHDYANQRTETARIKYTLNLNRNNGLFRHTHTHIPTKRETEKG